MVVSRGAFLSTENSVNFVTGSNGTEISLESFQKIRKLSNFRKATHSTENSRKSGGKSSEISLRKIFGTSGKRLVQFFFFEWRVSYDYCSEKIVAAFTFAFVVLRPI